MQDYIWCMTIRWSHSKTQHEMYLNTHKYGNCFDMNSSMFQEVVPFPLMFFLWWLPKFTTDFPQMEHWITNTILTAFDIISFNNGNPLVDFSNYPLFQTNSHFPELEVWKIGIPLYFKIMKTTGTVEYSP